MRFFQRAATEAGQSASSSIKAWWLHLLPAFSLVFLGVFATTLLLVLTLFGSAESAQRQSLTNAWAQSQAGALRQAVRQLSADTLGVASSPALLAALQGADAVQISALEKSLQGWRLDGLVDVHLNTKGQTVEQDLQRPAPLSYATRDMLQRAENGQSVAPEAYQINSRWLVYSAAPVRGEQGILGSLLLVFDLQRLLNSLPKITDDIGQLQLLQKFEDAPKQVLFKRGEALGEALALDIGNPNWTLSFTAGPGLQVSAYSPALLLIACLFSLVGGVLGVYLAQSNLQRRVNKDAQLLSRFFQASDHSQVPVLALPSLQALAQLMTRLGRGKAEATAAVPRPPEPPAIATPTTPVAATPAAAASTAAKAAASQPVFQDVDILDIDILDQDQDLLGLEKRPAMSTSKSPQLPASIFRAYDIRGVVGETLTTETAYWIGRAIGSESLARGESSVCVGRDGRLSGPELLGYLIRGLCETGCQVIDIGMVPTPVLYYATHVLKAKSGVMLTGSHNPPNYNGFKIVIAGETLANEQIQALYKRICDGDLASGQGKFDQLDILPRYFQQIVDSVKLARPLKVVVDCGNGVAGVIAPKLLEFLGCTVVPLYCDVDGHFPNHHPDPGKPENLRDLISKVQETQADVGLAFDGDADRVGVVTNTGNIIYPDRLLMLFAKDVVKRNPGAEVIFDVKCTRRLISLISGYGGRPLMWKTGHSLIKKKMKETGALLAGEMSGHIFFKERWFGFDDGIYSAARLLEILSREKSDCERLFSAFPEDISTPEINITVTDESKFTLIEGLQHFGKWGEGQVATLDGVRVDYPKGWGLVRASNTTPVLVLRFEAESEEELERIKAVFRSQLNVVAPELELPF